MSEQGLSRRRFLAVSAGTVGAVGAVQLDATLRGPGAHASVVDPHTDGQVVHTVCELCFWKCGIQAHVQHGRVTKIQGNPLHPLSLGRLCPRGTGGGGLAHDPDRLARPLVRVGPRGSDRFEAVSWDIALGTIADKMQDIRRRHGPEAIAMFNHGAGASWFRHLFKAWGTSNIAAPSFAQCRGPRDVAFDLTFGADPGSPEVLDIAAADCLVLIGSHLGENMHNTQVQEFADFVAKGGDLIVVDPRHSVAASKARTWLPIRPGTDTALLLAWMNVLITENRYQRDYIAQYALGFDELAQHVAPFTPEWAAAETGLDPAVIRATARRMAAAAPAALVHPGRHATWYGDDTQRSRAIAILDALLGAWGHRGGFFLPAGTRLAPFPTPPYPSARPAADRRTDEAPFAAEPIAQGLRRATLDGDPYPIKGWFVYGTNLIQSIPQKAETLRAIEALDLLVAVDVLPSEIVGYADVVLPEASYLERYDDLLGLSWRRGTVSLRQPAVAPPGDAKPGWWIAKHLSDRLGLGTFFPWNDVQDYLRERCRRSNLDYDTLARDGVIVGPERASTVEDGAALSFHTPSGKIELASERLRARGFDALPTYHRPSAPPEGFFRLLYGRAPAQTFGRTANNRQLGELTHGDRLWLNATAAAGLGVQNGDRVRMTNQDGARSEPIEVKVTERIRADCVFMPHGWGHTARGLRYALGKGVDDGAMITRVDIDPVMGGTGMRGNFVSIQREV